MLTTVEELQQRLVNDFIDAICNGTLQEVEICLQAGVSWDGQRNLDSTTALFWLALNQESHDGIAKLKYLYQHVLNQGESERWKLHLTVVCHNYVWIIQQLILMPNVNIINDSLLLREAALSGSVDVTEIICNGQLNVNGAYLDSHMADDKWIEPLLIEDPQREGAGEDSIEDYQAEGQAIPLAYLPAVAIIAGNQIKPQEPTAPLILQIAYRAMQLDSFPLRYNQTGVLVNNENPIYENAAGQQVISPMALSSQPYYQTLYRLLNVLRRAGANFALVDSYRNTVLHYLARYCYAKETQEISSYITLVALIANINFVDVDATNDRGDTALHVATKFVNQPAIQALAGAGADIYLKNLEQQTAYQIAEINQLLPILLRARVNDM